MIEVLLGSIIIDILEDKQFDGKFYPRSEVERKEIETDICMTAFFLCMDVYYEYCFEIGKSGSQMILKYKIESESTMPLP